MKIPDDIKSKLTDSQIEYLKQESIKIFDYGSIYGMVFVSNDGYIENVEPYLTDLGINIKDYEEYKRSKQ